MTFEPSEVKQINWAVVQELQDQVAQCYSSGNREKAEGILLATQILIPKFADCLNWVK